MNGNHQESAFRQLFVLITASLLLTGCLTSGEYTIADGSQDVVGNSAPRITGDASAELTAGETYSFIPTVTDADNNTLSFTINGLPSWASFDSSTGELSGTPQAADVGTYSGITMTVSDGQAEDTIGPFTITVIEAYSNSAPNISGSPPSNVNAGEQYLFSPTASDADNDTLSFTVAALPSWADFRESDGRILGTPQSGDVDTYSGITITVSDGQAQATLGPFTITVQSVSLSSGTFPGVPAYSFRDQLPDLGDTPDVTSCSSNGMSVNGTPDNWLVVTINQNDRCMISGSYFVIQNSTLNHQMTVSGGPYAIRNNDIDSPGTGGAVNPSGSDILIEGNVIRDNGTIPSSADRHGINVGGSTSGLWVLSNYIHHNSGDAIQFCHSCVGGSHNGPANVYIAGNVMHDDEENAIDLKEFLGPVVVVCNEMYGYERGTHSGNGEAVRVNDEGQQGELWMSKNNYHDNLTDIAPYRSRADGYYLDEGNINFNDDDRSGTVARVNGAAALPYYDQYQAKYGLDLSAACPR